MAERYLSTDMFRPMISGSYLAGNPMAGDSFTHSLLLTPAAAKVFVSGGLERYDFSLNHDLAQNDPPRNGGNKLDAGGKHTLSIPMNEFTKTNYLANLHFETTGKTAEGKEFPL